MIFPSRNFWRRALASLLLAVFTAACQPVGEPPLRVGLSPWVGYDPLVLARERGHLDAGRLRIVELASGSECMRGLRNGVLEAAAITLDMALRLRAEGVPLQIVAVLDISAGADAVVAHAPIRTPVELVGRRIGVEETALGALILHRLLEAGGLARGEVEIYPMTLADHEKAFVSRRVDAVITYEPIASALLDEGGRIIFDSRQMPGEIMDVLVVRSEVLEARQTDIAALLLAWQKAVEELHAAPAEAAKVLAAGGELSPKQYLDALAGVKILSLRESQPWLGGAPSPLRKQAAVLGDIMLAAGLLHGPPDLEGLSALQPAAAALSRLPAPSEKASRP